MMFIKNEEFKILRAIDLIVKKRNGNILTEEEIKYFIIGYVSGKIPDYQMSAMLMAIYFKGMNINETKHLTLEMVKSGNIVDLKQIHGIKVDKHSTGGVGDTTTLALAPMVAALGVPVAKMSGRGLGHTGGTIDKLESIKGYKTELSLERFIEIVKKIGISVINPTANLAPADKKIYALRDVTGTIESIPLIVGSIMSKKIAAGADKIVLDVTTGSGAFMKNFDNSLRLAKIMVEIGTELGKETIAVISNMEEPLGFAIGNSLEVKEAIDILRNKGPEDLRRICLVLGSYMLKLGGVSKTIKEGEKKLISVLKNGLAFRKFKEMVQEHGGNVNMVENPKLLPAAKHCMKLKGKEKGYIQKIDSRLVGQSAMILGAGREDKNSKIDLSVGILLRKKVGDSITTNEVLAEIYYNNAKKLEEAKKILLSSFKIGEKKQEKLPLILAAVDKDGTKMFKD